MQTTLTSPRQLVKRLVSYRWLSCTSRKISTFSVNPEDSKVSLRELQLTQHQYVEILRKSNSKHLYLSRRFSGSIDHEPKQVLPIRILWASQGGTARIFAAQLLEAIQEIDPDREVTIAGVHEAPTPSEILEPGKALHIFLLSVAGVGEPPDLARGFYEWLMRDAANLRGLQYTVFGLGNQQAHPNHFNVIGKNVDQKLEELGAQRMFELGLGDDGDCIEDDFDGWSERLMALMYGEDEADRLLHIEDDVTPEEAIKNAIVPEVPVSDEDQRMTSKKYPTLKLSPRVNDVVKSDLFHLQGTDNSFYAEDTIKVEVNSNKVLTTDMGEFGIRELALSIEDHPHAMYEAGDHVLMYPRNSHCIVEAYLNVLDVDPHATIVGQADTSSTQAYPHPTGITVYETLSHCVDLGAVPNPSFSKMLLGSKDIDYKHEIALQRRTVIGLIHQSGKVPSLEDLLYNLPPMKPRYYSIASSPLVHPKQIILNYRPVKYMNSRGMLREGVCTTYMAQLCSGPYSRSVVPAIIRQNPTFRLPKDPQTGVMLVAGGCGIAPIRAFLEERMAMSQTKFGVGHLFLGFRSPQDAVYLDMVQGALDHGALTNYHISYTGGCVRADQNCEFVAEAVRRHGEEVYKFVIDGGYVYLCGGARTFGAAVERELLELLQKYGGMDFDAATAYLQKMIKEGRLCEDLAD